MALIWLASYPKSGNTWVRIFLANYMRAKGQPVDINAELIGSPFHLERHLFDEKSGIASSDLRPSELDLYRPDFHAALVDSYTGNFFSKVHEAYLTRSTGQPMFPADENVRAIYLVRNPLDIVPSYAHHDSVSCDAIIRRMADQKASLPRGDHAFTEHIGSWSQHVREWTEQSAMQTLIIRYEDLLSDPYENFHSILDFSGFEIDPEKTGQAIGFSDFKALKALEARDGFKDRQSSAKSFFRKGIAGEGKKILDQKQIDKVIECHADVMERFGYLPLSAVERSLG